MHVDAINHLHSIVKTRRHLEPNTTPHDHSNPKPNPRHQRGSHFKPPWVTAHTFGFLRWQSGAPPQGTGPLFPKHHALCKEGVLSSSSSSSPCWVYDRSYDELISSGPTFSEFQTLLAHTDILYSVCRFTMIQNKNRDTPLCCFSLLPYIFHMRGKS